MKNMFLAVAFAFALAITPCFAAQRFTYHAPKVSAPRVAPRVNTPRVNAPRVNPGVDRGERGIPVRNTGRNYQRNDGYREAHDHYRGGRFDREYFVGHFGPSFGIVWGGPGFWFGTPFGSPFFFGGVYFGFGVGYMMPLEYQVGGWYVDEGPAGYVIVGLFGIVVLVSTFLIGAIAGASTKK